jgi:uncharacterized membrane protein YphA (DoxX/SURF4 family)
MMDYYRNFENFSKNIGPILKDPLLLTIRILLAWRLILDGQFILGNIQEVSQYFASIGIPLPGGTLFNPPLSIISPFRT